MLSVRAIPPPSSSISASPSLVANPISLVNPPNACAIHFPTAVSVPKTNLVIETLSADVVRNLATVLIFSLRPCKLEDYISLLYLGHYIFNRMVYCGKPSRGCQMCRTRRIKVYLLPNPTSRAVVYVYIHIRLRLFPCFPSPGDSLLTYLCPS